MPQPYTSLIDPRCAWVPRPAPGHVFSASEQRPDRPTHLWRDVTLVQNRPNRDVVAWWAGIPPAPSFEEDRWYRTIARNTDGSPALCPIGSPEMINTYTLILDPATGQLLPRQDTNAVLANFRNFSFLFPDGVPYLKLITVKSDDAKEINFPQDGQLPTWDYPIGLRADSMLLVENGDVVVYTEAEFRAKYNFPQGQSDEAKVSAIRNVLNRGGSAATILQQITLIMQSSAPKAVIT